MNELKLDDLGIVYSENTLATLDLVLAGILKNSDQAKEVMGMLNTLVKKEECEGFHYIFMSMIERLLSIRSVVPKSNLKITKLNFKQYVNTHIIEFLESPAVNAKKMFEDIQVSITATETAEDLLKEQRLLYSICLKKFDLLMTHEVSTEDMFMLLDSLYEKCISDYCINSVRLQAITLNQGLVIHGKRYAGNTGYVEIMRKTYSKIMEKQSMWEGADSNTMVLDSPEAYNRVMEKYKFRMAPITKMGFPPIDKFSTLTTADIINLTATEGTGKTTYCCALAAREIREGFSIIYMCGETTPPVIMNMILSHFIFLETGYEISWKELAYIYKELTQDILDNAGEGEVLEDFKDIPEEYIAIANDCKFKMYSDPKYGKIILKEVFTYNSFFEEACDILDVHTELKFGHIFIDHTDALVIDNTKGKLYFKSRHEAVGELFKQIVQLKIKRGVPCFTTSHTGSDTEKAIVAGKETGTRVGATNSGTSKDVDIVILFECTPKLKSQGLIKVTIKKYRTIDDTLFVPFIVKKDFTACRFLYTAELQAILGNANQKQLNLEDTGIAGMNAEELIGE